MDRKQTSSITPDSLKAWPECSVAVVAHDAGASRHLFNWLEPISQKLKFYVEGPAAKLQQQSFPHQPNQASLTECLEGCKLLITGTSWSSDLEHESRLMARQKKIPSIAVLDHWVNYKERFARNQKLILPDAIWVSDKEAEKIALKEFADTPINLLENTWLVRLAADVKMIRQNSNKPTPEKPGKVLTFFLEPLRDRKTGEPNKNEFVALNYWIKNLKLLINEGIISAKKHELLLVLKPHPSERKGKYDLWVEEKNPHWNIKLDTSESLEYCLSRTDIAFGCETQALVAAIACSIPSYSTMPSDFPNCRLPHKHLKHIKDLQEKADT